MGSYSSKFKLEGGPEGGGAQRAALSIGATALGPNVLIGRAISRPDSPRVINASVLSSVIELFGGPRNSGLLFSKEFPREPSRSIYPRCPETA